MARDNSDILEALKFELKFLEDGGYGRSPRNPRIRPLVFLDSPSCPNFSDPNRPNLCQDCLLMQFVPAQHRTESIPCQHIELNHRGETLDTLYRWGTQAQLEGALASWLRETIERMEFEPQESGDHNHVGGCHPARCTRSGGCRAGVEDRRAVRFSEQEGPKKYLA